MTSCREILGQILELLKVGVNLLNTSNEKIDPATLEEQRKNFPSIYYSDKITSASTSNTTITPGFSITHTKLINLDAIEVIFSIGEATGTTHKDIILPAEGVINLTHGEATYMSYKGAASGAAFIYILQGNETS